ncbi:transposase [Bradyrhizobium sp. i1.8.4]
MTFLGALRYDRLAAPCLFDGPINGECFRAYVEQILLPSLKPGDVVIMDNLGSHKSAALRRILRAAGARLWYLPPYSPDLNPIEQTFAKIKRKRSAAALRFAHDAYFDRSLCRLGFQIPDSALTAASSAFRSTTSGSNCSGPQRRIRSCSGWAGSLMASRYSA